MHVVPIIVVVGLWLLFPKSFPYVVGSWVGACAGGFCWAVAAIATGCLWSGAAFLTFAAVGIVGGCWLAAKG